MVASEGSGARLSSNPTLPLLGCVTLGKLLDLSVLQVPYS